MQHQIETMWMGHMQFNALIDGHTVIMDTPEKAGGEDQGPIPKPFILSALSGCTGMDVIAILKRQDRKLSDLNIRITGELSKQAPIEYTSIHVIYDAKGAADDEQATFEAIHRSQEKICGVSHMLKKIMPVSWEIIYNGIPIFNNQLQTITT